MIFASLALVCACAQAEETLTWEDCVREAAKNNPALISSKESVKSTEAAKSITASGLFPQVSAKRGSCQIQDGDFRLIGRGRE